MMWFTKLVDSKFLQFLVLTNQGFFLQVAKDLVFEKAYCPVGVLLIIFESRPDALVQVIFDSEAKYIYNIYKINNHLWLIYYCTDCISGNPKW